MNTTENIFKDEDDLTQSSNNDFQLEDISMDDLFSSSDDDIDETDDEPLENPEKELTEEIKSFRDKQKEFAATNDHQTYLIVVFSTKDDRNDFLKNSNLQSSNDTFINGYELAALTNIEPKKPAIKLPAPIHK